MSWLDNPLANMYGPHFLLLYMAVIVVSLSVLYFWLRRLDPTAGQSIPPIPTEPDPYQVAYLRGGLREVAHVAVFELLQRGYITGKNGYFEVVSDAPTAPDLWHLQGIPRVAHDWLQTRGGFSAREVFGSKGLVPELRKAEPELRQPLETGGLVATNELKRSRLWLTACVAVPVLSLGAYKLTAALMKGYSNVIFLIMMLLAALIAAIVISMKMSPRTARGQKYLDALNLAFNQLTTRAETGLESAYLPLMVGLFGATALAGTSYAFYADDLEQLRQAAQSSDGAATLATSCGSSCGGSCSGGCGGGCGGCGG